MRCQPGVDRAAIDQQLRYSLLVKALTGGIQMGFRIQGFQVAMEYFLFSGRKPWGSRTPISSFSVMMTSE